jgi:hypothetical protein
MRVGWGFALCILVAGCGDSARRAPADASVDAGARDAGTADVGPRDAGEPDAGPPRCEDLTESGAPFEIAPELPTTQIHASVAFDGEATWLAFNIPEEGDTGLFDVFAMRLACDGSVVTPPFQVNTTTPPNDADPSVAISDDRVIVAWHSDDSSLEHNLDIRYRIFERDGTAVLADDRTLETTRGGVPVDGNALLPRAIARPAGGFWLAGMRGITEAPGFQIFVQAIAPDGALDGEALDFIEPEASQSNPDVAEDGDDLAVSWTRADTITDRAYVRLPGAATGMDLYPDLPPAGTPSLAIDGARRYAAAQASITTSDPDIYLVSLDAPADRVRVGARGRFDHSPVISLAPEGGVLAWYQNVRGLANDLVVASIDGATSPPTVGEPVPVSADHPAAPYDVAATRVSRAVWFFAWSSGTSPDLRVYGRFVAAP